MMEAEIRCVSPLLKLSDLDLTLTAGQVAYVPEIEAKASLDLARLSRAGGVTVRFVERFRERRDGQTTIAPVSLPERRFLQPLEAVAVPPQIVREVQVAAPVDEDRIVRRVTEQVVSRMNHLHGDLTATIRAALKDVVVQGASSKGSLRTTRATSVVDQDDDVPLFIPDVIDQKGSKAAISVESGVGDASVDDATAALRAMKSKFSKTEKES